MSSQEYFDCIDRAARAARPDEIERLRAEVVGRWHGDPRADDLAEALYAHQERLSEHAAAGRDSGDRSASRVESRTGAVMSQRDAPPRETDPDLRRGG
ncbi:MAG: hypothetical protein M3373_01815 [Gemmatimonadota bacterium]|nr:hypothetical protein [Gemmatimonadota bacterium]